VVSPKLGANDKRGQTQRYGLSNRGGPIGHDHATEPQFLQQELNHALVDPIILDHQQPAGEGPGTGRGGRAARKLRWSTQRQGEFEAELGADAEGTLDDDMPAHVIHELLGNREAKPRAAETAVHRAVTLGENLE